MVTTFTFPRCFPLYVMTLDAQRGVATLFDPQDKHTMFERTLQDLIRGLRAHKASSKAQEDAFLQEAMLEIREELKGKDMALKAEGILKVCYVSFGLCIVVDQQLTILSC
jgi:hypothetical protein